MRSNYEGGVFVSGKIIRYFVAGIQHGAFIVYLILAWKV